MRRAVATAATVALLVLAVPLPASADPPAVDFADGAATLAVRAGEPARVTLVNNTGTAYDVVVTARLPDGTGASAPATARLEPGGVATVTLAAPPPAVTAGFVVALARSEAGATVVARRPFRVSATGSWTPLVADWRVTSFRGPLLHGTRNAAVPLADGATCGDTGSAMVVGGVARAGGGAAVVTATCRAGARHVELSFAGLDGAGDYTGTVDLSPSAGGGGEVALTVRRTDDVLFPALLLLAGIALAVLAAWQSGRLSALSQAEEEAWLLQAEAAAAHQRFRAGAEGTPWQAYSFLAALTTRLDTVRSRLRALRWRLSEVDADKGPYKEHLDALTGLRALVEAWEPFGVRLAALAAARATAAAEPAAAPPAIAAHADQLLRGRDIGDTGEVPPLLADVDATASALRAWPDDERAARDLADLGATLEPAVGQGRDRDRERLSRALATVRTVRDEMAAAPDGAAYDTLDVDARLRDAAVELRALGRQYLGVLGTKTRTFAEGTGPVRVPEAASTLGEARASAAATAQRVALTRRLRNTLAFAAIASVTVWTGLTAMYFDHPFGTWRDYVAAAVWGFGAQAGLTVLIGALDRIIAGGPVARS
ncbi:hypothetical protein Psuf_076770 [Phytohabitans suffuscus]|uniref:Uncharacterized protein n=1 Tax=Phytohabitans suffuscus TaxID=624315 RepID=A0A6F8YWC5_9ACTN|nr:hypothetical protein [Phytohabitans suffuscus]BCB90364.1 hypothetical protein Psuf_076770 [Phytohabitans suffuscus]